MSGARKKTAQPKSSKKRTEYGSDSKYDESDLLRTYEQGVPSYRSSNDASSGYEEVKDPLEHMTSLYHKTNEKLHMAKMTIQTLERELAQYKQENDSLKKKDRKQQSDLQTQKKELVERDHKIETLLRKIKITEEEKQGLSQQVVKLTNEMKEMWQYFVATETDQNKKIEKLEREMESLPYRLISEMNARIEGMRVSIIQGLPQRPNAQTRAITNVRVPTALMHRSPQRSARLVNAPQTRIRNLNMPATHDESPRLSLPKIVHRK